MFLLCQSFLTEERIANTNMCALMSVLQMLGENVLGAVIEFAKSLKEQETKGLPEWDADGSVYFDFLGSKMVLSLP
jgi:hypothetical protein